MSSVKDEEEWPQRATFWNCTSPPTFVPGAAAWSGGRPAVGSLRSEVPMDYTRYQHLLIDVDEDGVALVTLNRPDVFNATNNVMHRELTEIWRDLDRDPAVKVILVTGAGDQAF